MGSGLWHNHAGALIDRFGHRGVQSPDHKSALPGPGPSDRASVSTAVPLISPTATRL